MSTPTNKLSELTVQNRPRVKYAPLTAGLLARKGEALPATPYFAAEALDLYNSPTPTNSRHEARSPAPERADRAERPERAEPAHKRRAANVSYEEAPEAPPRTPGWRSRHLPYPHEQSEEDLDHDDDNFAREQIIETRQQAVAPKAEPKPDAIHVTLSLEFDVEILALLAQYSRLVSKAPALVIEEALRAHLVSD